MNEDKLMIPWKKFVIGAEPPVSSSSHSLKARKKGKESKRKEKKGKGKKEEGRGKGEEERWEEREMRKEKRETRNEKQETRNKRREKSKEKIDIINSERGEIENKGIKYFIKRRGK